jgi:hypothetical protein
MTQTPRTVRVMFYDGEKLTLPNVKSVELKMRQDDQGRAGAFVYEFTDEAGNVIAGFNFEKVAGWWTVDSTEGKGESNG